MGAVEETRKLIQDFLAPELREIKARLEPLEPLEATTKIRFEAIEGTNKARFDAVDARLDGVDQHFASMEDMMKSRFDAQDKIMAAQHAAVLSALSSLTNYAILAERLTKLEGERGQQAH